MTASFRRFASAGLTATCLTFASPAQCGLAVVPGDPLRPLRGDVEALTTWDPDGAGPLPSHLVAGGTFDAADVVGEHVVLWNGTEWTPTHANFGHVAHLIVWNGLLVAAAAELLYTFDGTTWTLLAGVEEGAPSAPLPGVVNALALWNGDLVVGGRFARVTTPSVSVNANMVAVLDASTGWSALGSGPDTTSMTAPEVRALTVFNGTVWAGLGFTTNFANVRSLQFLNAGTWSGHGTGVDPIDALAARIGTAITNSWMFVASRPLFGTSVSLTGFNPVLGTTTPITVPPVVNLTSVDQVFVRATGLSSYEVACTITVTPPSPSTPPVWRWTAAGGWTSLPTLFHDGPVCVHFFGGRYVAGVYGWTDEEGSLQAHDSTSGAWTTLLGPGFDSTVFAMCQDGQEFVVGGVFSNAGTMAANCIARGHPGAWAPLGPGFTAGPVRAIVRMPNGDIVAGGSFLTLGDGTPMSRIARWDGTAWHPLGAGLDGEVHALLTLPNGDLIAAGKFGFSGSTQLKYVARWDGSSWTSLGGGCNSWVYAMTRAANGDVVVGGQFSVAGSTPALRVARWNGSAWSAIGAGFSHTVFALADTSEGLVAGGVFTSSGTVIVPHLAKWDGSAWQRLDPVAPSQPIYSLAPLPSGGVAVGGVPFTVPVLGSPVTTSAATWRFGAWGTLETLGSVNAFVACDDGRLALVGNIPNVLGRVSVNFARIESTCPASATTFAPGCPSSGGSNTLSALTLPWAFATLRTRATGLPATAVAVVVTSVTSVVPGLPLAAVLPEGVPGCDLHVAPDIVLGVTVTNGAADAALLLPNSPPIVGVVFHQQMLPIDLGGPLAITATNALRFTAGLF